MLENFFWTAHAHTEERALLFLLIPSNNNKRHDQEFDHENRTLVQLSFVSDQILWWRMDITDIKEKISTVYFRVKGHKTCLWADVGRIYATNEYNWLFR